MTSQYISYAGAVTSSTYISYFATTTRGKSGIVLYTFILFIFALSQTGQVYGNIWVGLWAADQQRESPPVALDQLRNHKDQVGPNRIHSDLFWLIWYVVIVWGTTILVAFRSWFFVKTCLGASRNMHEIILSAVLKAPVNTYFDVTPVGIRFSIFCRMMFYDNSSVYIRNL